MKPLAGWPSAALIETSRLIIQPLRVEDAGEMAELLDDTSLHAFIAEQGRELAGKHHEIYLGDPRRSAPEKLKTIIRQPMR